MNLEAMRVLLIEDNPSDARLIQEMLVEGGGVGSGAPAFDMALAGRLSTGLDHLARGGINVVLLDLWLPDSQGLETVERVHAQSSNVPIVVLTGLEDATLGVKAVQEGAQDYLVKGQMDGNLLVRALRYAIERQRLLVEKEQQAQGLRSSEARFRTIIEENADGIVITDKNGIIRFVNPAVETLFGQKAEELVGEPFGFPVVAGEISEVAIARRDGHDEPVTAEIRVVETVWEEEPAYLASMRDITRVQHEREREAVVTVATALRTAPTRTDMLPIILNQLFDLFDVDGAALAMRDPANGETVIELAYGDWTNRTDARLPPGEGVSGHVIASGQTYLHNEELRAVACVPLIAQEQTIGALSIDRQTTITAEELHLFTAIGDMAANAIRRATLHEQTERRLQHLAALHDIDMAITSLDLGITLSVLLDQVTTQLVVDAADVLLYNPRAQTLKYTAGHGFRTAALQHTLLRVGEGHAGRAALEQRVVHISNLAGDKDGLARAPLLAHEDFITYYGVPLIVKEQVKGVLEIFHRAPLDPDPEWLNFLEMLAIQAAIAIDNAQLFNELQRSNVELTQAYDATLRGWGRALELRDAETEGHARRVTDTTLRLARAWGMNEAELVHVRRGTLLHDIGKTGIPDNILLKPGPLSDEEWVLMRKHPVYAYNLLFPIPFLRPAMDIPYCHHEKWDGTGYPRKLSEQEIPLAARIFAVIDVWDAMCSDRPYRQAYPEERALEYIREQAGTHFDPQVVEVFLGMLKQGAP